MFLAPPSAGVAARHWARHFSRPCPIPETFPAKEAARHRPSQLLFSRTLSEPPRSSTSRFGLSNRIFGVVFTTLFNQAPPRKVSLQLCDLWTPGRSNRILGTVLVISIQSNGIPTTVSAVSIQLERLRWNPPIVPLSDFSSVEGSAKIDDLYSVEQAEDTIIPTIVLSNTSPKPLVSRLYDVDTVRQPAHTILFDIGRNFLQSFFLPVSALLAPQRLLRLCGLSSRISLPSTSNNKWTPSSESNTFSTAGTSSSTFRVLFENSVPSPATSGRLIPGRTLLLHRRDFLFHFPGFCSKTQSITINKRTPFSGLNTTSPPQATSFSTSRGVFRAQHFPTAGDFFFRFPGFVRGPASLLAPTATSSSSTFWVLFASSLPSPSPTSGRLLRGRTPHLARQRLLLPLSGVCSQTRFHHQHQRQPSTHQDGFLQHSRAVVPHHRAQRFRLRLSSLGPWPGW